MVAWRWWQSASAFAGFASCTRLLSYDFFSCSLRLLWLLLGDDDDDDDAAAAASDQLFCLTKFFSRLMFTQLCLGLFFSSSVSVSSFLLSIFAEIGAYYGNNGGVISAARLFASTRRRVRSGPGGSGAGGSRSVGWGVRVGRCLEPGSQCDMEMLWKRAKTPEKKKNSK